MTTIAYHHDTRRIAVDGRITVGDLIACDSYQKWRAVDEEIWFLTGATADFDRFIAYHQKRLSGQPEHVVSCSAIVASTDGCFEVGLTREGEPWRSLVTYDTAMGSGRDFALGAMDHGKCAVEAIKYASKRDSATGGKISVFDLSTMSFRSSDAEQVMQ